MQDFLVSLLARLAWAACDYVIARLAAYYMREVIPAS